MNDFGYDIAIVGATGLVGEVFLEVLVERAFPIGQFYPLASESSVGKTVMLGSEPHKVGNVAEFDFSKVQFAFFSAGSEVSSQFATKAAEAGAIVIDNTACFRYQDDIPLIVPEVNPARLMDYRERNIIANPNCSTIQLAVALKPIYDAAGIERINVATYQSVSGAGRGALEELVKQTAELLNGQDATVSVLPKQIAFNVLPHIDAFQDNGYTREEMKLVWETQKIFEDPSILVNATAVRVPVFYGHSEVVHIETSRPISVDEVKVLLSQAPSVVVVDDPDYPTAITDAASQNDVYVGRIRADISHPRGIDLWVVADNVRKGAALNAVQIAELLVKENFFVR